MTLHQTNLQKGYAMPLIANGTFAQVIRAFQTSAKFKALEPTTQDNYARALRIAEAPDALGGLPVELLRPSLIQAFLDGFADAPGSQKIARVALSSLESWAVVRDLLPRAIMTGVTVQAGGGGHEPWSFEQVAVAETYAGKGLDRVVSLAVHTGQRGSDIVRMRRSHIAAHGGRDGIRVVQQKTGRKLWVPFTSVIAHKISSWSRTDQDYLVTNVHGEPYNRPLLSVTWGHERDENTRLASLAGLTLHGLRATAVVRARKDGLGDLQISNLYGMSEQMVARYSRLAAQVDMALAAVATIERVALERAAAVTKNNVIKLRR
jgi:integrase